MRRKSASLVDILLLPPCFLNHYFTFSLYSQPNHWLPGDRQLICDGRCDCCTGIPGVHLLWIEGHCPIPVFVGTHEWQRDHGALQLYIGLWWKTYIILPASCYKHLQQLENAACQNQNVFCPRGLQDTARGDQMLFVVGLLHFCKPSLSPYPFLATSSQSFHLADPHLTIITITDRISVGSLSAVYAIQNSLWDHTTIYVTTVLYTWPQCLLQVSLVAQCPIWKSRR